MNLYLKLFIIYFYLITCFYHSTHSKKSKQNENTDNEAKILKYDHKNITLSGEYNEEGGNSWISTQQMSYKDQTKVNTSCRRDADCYWLKNGICFLYDCTCFLFSIRRGNSCFPQVYLLGGFCNISSQCTTPDSECRGSNYGDRICMCKDGYVSAGYYACLRNTPSHMNIIIIFAITFCIVIFVLTGFIYWRKGKKMLEEERRIQSARDASLQRAIEEINRHETILEENNPPPRYEEVVKHNDTTPSRH